MRPLADPTFSRALVALALFGGAGCSAHRAAPTGDDFGPPREDGAVPSDGGRDGGIDGGIGPTDAGRDAGIADAAPDARIADAAADARIADAAADARIADARVPDAGVDTGPIVRDDGGVVPSDRWRETATTWRGRIGETFSYECPPPGAPSGVWGTDVYTDDSSVCTAGVHVGVITLDGGGTVTIHVLEGLPSYAGSTRHGVTSSDWTTSWHGSFEVVP